MFLFFYWPDPLATDHPTIKWGKKNTSQQDCSSCKHLPLFLRVCQACMSNHRIKQLTHTRTKANINTAQWLAASFYLSQMETMLPALKGNKICPQGNINVRVSSGWSRVLGFDAQRVGWCNWNVHNRGKAWTTRKEWGRKTGIEETTVILLERFGPTRLSSIKNREKDEMSCLYVVSKATPRIVKTPQSRHMCIWKKTVDEEQDEPQWSWRWGGGVAFGDQERETKARVRKSEAGVWTS